jgi:demethoxyubiquinone hydroxylase (CLK1/Coq7/Cat5 family)
MLSGFPTLVPPNFITFITKILRGANIAEAHHNNVALDIASGKIYTVEIIKTTMPAKCRHCQQLNKKLSQLRF